MTSPRGGRSGHGRRRGAKPELSTRDVRILTDLGRVRLLTGRLIQRLHFEDGSPLTAARKSRSTLQRLSELGLVTRLERTIGGERAGSSGFVYGLSGKGQRLLDLHGPAGGTRRRKPWQSSRLFVDHILAVSQLYVELRQAERAEHLELLSFDAEPAAWRPWHGSGCERRILKPDAYLHTATGEYEHLWFIEVDRGTESLTVIRRKAEVYADYWQSGGEQQHHGLFPKVLWLTLGGKRRSDITATLAKLDPRVWRLFQVGLLEEARPILAGASEPSDPNC